VPADSHRLSPSSLCPLPLLEAGMSKQAALENLPELVTLFFLTAGLALGAAIALAWLMGLMRGFFAVITR
jgi:hypothetical protein